MSSQISEQRQDESAIKNLPAWMRQMLEDRMERYLSAETDHDDSSERKSNCSEKSTDAA